MPQWHYPQEIWCLSKPKIRLGVTGIKILANLVSRGQAHCNTQCNKGLILWKFVSCQYRICAPGSKFARSQPLCCIQIGLSDHVHKCFMSKWLREHIILYLPEKWLHNWIYYPSNRSKQIQETHTAYSAGTQYTRQSLNEKQHTWLHRQQVNCLWSHMYCLPFKLCRVDCVSAL